MSRKPIQCPVNTCPKSLAGGKGVVARHLNAFHSGADLDLTCPLCNAQFRGLTWEAFFNNHIARVHTRGPLPAIELPLNVEFDDISGQEQYGNVEQQEPLVLGPALHEESAQNQELTDQELTYQETMEEEQTYQEPTEELIEQIGDFVDEAAVLSDIHLCPNNPTISDPTMKTTVV